MPRNIEASDIARIRFVSDPQVSPDGARVAYVVTTMLLEEKRYRSRIWIANVDDNSSPVEMTRGDGKDTSPRWSPDGQSLAFLTDRWGQNQIAVLDTGGGEAQQISDLYDGVQEFDWSSSGRGFLFVAKADHDQTLKHRSDVEQREEDESKPDEDPANEPKRITTLAHRMDGTGYRDGRRNHVGIVLLSGRIVQLTAGDFDHAHPALSPCRRYLAFSANRSDERDNERRTDIWVLDLDTDSLRRITGHDGVYGLPTFSPDGRKLAFSGHQVEKPFGPTSLDRIWIADLETGQLSSLTEGIDREMSNTCTGDSSYGVPSQRPVWERDGSAVLSLVSDRGNVGIVRIAIDGRSKPLIDGNREVVNFTSAHDRTVAYTAADPLRPAEVFLLAPGQSRERRISSHNDDLLAEVSIVEPVRVPVTARDGAEIDVWLIEPAGYTSGVKYPLVLEIHGGPHAMYGNTFFHEFQLLAAQGYGVLYTNPRGSTGYGQQFVSAAMGDWGGIDYRDIIDALDQTCSQTDWVDLNRLGVTGGSYGGYMVNWMLTQTDRFAAAITQRSTCNRHSLFGSSDLVWTYAEWEFRGLPWESADFYYDRSPLSHVDRVSTPVLIMHSEQDLRCPVEQGEQWFTALKRLGKTVEFVRFPEESHNLSRSGRPDRRIERLHWMLDWFGRWL